MPMIRVRAKDKTKPVPMERAFPVLDATGRNLSMIYDVPVDVPDTEYYRRAIGKDLELVPPPAAKKE